MRMLWVPPGGGTSVSKERASQERSMSAAFHRFNSSRDSLGKFIHCKQYILKGYLNGRILVRQQGTSHDESPLQTCEESLCATHRPHTVLSDRQIYD
jgi:hypothetical protein